MTSLRLVPLAVLLVVPAGCGGGGSGRHDVALWVTRDEGAKVLVAARVSSGATAAQALEGVAKVKTRYGGDFIQAIDGLSGGGHHDWFFYVNGYAADRGAADYVLHPGDVEWWDYRHWKNPGEAPLVVGSFPEPFLHGYNGKTRPAAIRYAAPGDAVPARRLGRILRATSVARVGKSIPDGANVLYLVPGPTRFVIRYRSGHGTAGDPVAVVFAGDARALARNPHRFSLVYTYP